MGEIDLSLDGLNIKEIGGGVMGVRVTTRVPVDVFLALRDESPDHIKHSTSLMLSTYLYEQLKFSVANVKKQRKEEEERKNEQRTIY